METTKKFDTEEFIDKNQKDTLKSIYEDLEKVVVPGGKRKQPLCKQVYGFKGDLMEELDEGIR